MSLKKLAKNPIGDSQLATLVVGVSIDVITGIVLVLFTDWYENDLKKSCVSQVKRFVRRLPYYQFRAVYRKVKRAILHKVMARFMKQDF